MNGVRAATPGERVELFGASGDGPESAYWKRLNWAPNWHPIRLANITMQPQHPALINQE